MSRITFDQWVKNLIGPSAKHANDAQAEPNANL